MATDTTVDARRFLHCCYCCDDFDAAVAFLTDGLGLKLFMRTTGGSFDGASLGLDGLVEANVGFVYDARGPRTSPAIEVQAWVKPPAVGEPHVAPTAIGVQALGIALSDINRAITRIEGAGANV